jgi:hypothetical protein
MESRDDGFFTAEQRRQRLGRAFRNQPDETCGWVDLTFGRGDPVTSLSTVLVTEESCVSPLSERNSRKQPIVGI